MKRFYADFEASEKCPHRKLWAAVLGKAIQDLFPAGGDKSVNTLANYRVLEREARDWLLCDAFEEGSYLWVCEVLDLDALALREAIGKLKELKVKGACMVAAPRSTVLQERCAQ